MSMAGYLIPRYLIKDRRVWKNENFDVCVNVNKCIRLLYAYYLGLYITQRQHYLVYIQLRIYVYMTDSGFEYGRGRSARGPKFLADTLKGASWT